MEDKNACGYNSLFKQAIVYEKRDSLTCWSLHDYTVDVCTYVVQYSFLWFIWYSIKQIIPLLPDPHYDGEYASNRKVRMVAKVQRKDAKRFIHYLKSRDKE